MLDSQSDNTRQIIQFFLNIIIYDLQKYIPLKYQCQTAKAINTLKHKKSASNIYIFEVQDLFVQYNHSMLKIKSFLTFYSRPFFFLSDLCISTSFSISFE